MKRSITIALLLGALIAVSTTSPASAAKGETWDKWGYRWYQSDHPVGNPNGCGDSGTQELAAVQAVSWADGDYPDFGSSNSYVDGIYGTQTANAIKKFQSKRGLAQDGCAGYNTLRAMQSGSMFQWLYFQPGDGGNPAQDVYRAKSGYSQYVTFVLRYYGCWQFQWFNGWHNVWRGSNMNSDCYQGANGLYPSSPYVGYW